MIIVAIVCVQMDACGTKFVRPFRNLRVWDAGHTGRWITVVNFARTIITSTARASSVSSLSYRNMNFNQSAHIFC